MGYLKISQNYCRTIDKPFFVLSSIWWAFWNWDRGTLWQFNTFAYHMEFSLWTPPKECHHQQNCHINLLKYNSNETAYIVTLLWNHFCTDMLVCLLIVLMNLNRICDTSVDSVKLLVLTYLRNLSEKIVRFDTSQESMWKEAKIVKGSLNCKERLKWKQERNKEKKKKHFFF